MALENERLKHGKALCGKVFARFVETFNGILDFVFNIKGDAEWRNGEGHITVDRNDPLHPVIRCDGCCGSGVAGEDEEEGEEEEEEEGGGGGGSVTANENSGLEVTDGEIDLIGRNPDESFGIRKLTFKTGDGEDDKKEYQILAEKDIEIEQKQECVESLNGETGAMEISGGHKVSVSTDGKTITISLDEAKEDPEKDPNTSCDDHPGSDPGGGVPSGIGGGGGGAWGVPAGDGPASSGVGCDC